MVVSMSMEGRTKSVVGGGRRQRAFFVTGGSESKACLKVGAGRNQPFGAWRWRDVGSLEVKTFGGNITSPASR
jgi:hypothetical protein